MDVAQGVPVLPEAGLEIRLHGRGGQGGVTCAKIIAAVYASLGKSVQTFGDYSSERSGAPVRAYTRVADLRIENRNKIYRPDHLLVLDPTLLAPDILAGLAPGGLLLINTPQSPGDFAGRFDAQRLATVDATAIARAHRIGARSVIIVNTTIAGAFVHALGLPLAALEEAYEHLGLTSNLAAARDAWEQVQVREPLVEAAKGPARAAALQSSPDVMPLVDHREGRSSGLATGSWRTQTPYYVDNLAPCSAFCPAGNDVIGFLQAVSTQSPAAASAVLGQSTPLAAVCGRVCPAPCMEGCNRAEHDGAVNIRGVERWIADHKPVAVQEAAPNAAPRRLAVVGGGPAGLSAAYVAARLGHKVTLFDGERALGGVLRTGIPVYRLPRAVLDREVAGIVGLGVEVRGGHRLTPAELAALPKEYDAVILATGLQRLRGLGAGVALPAGVEQGLDFLRRLNEATEAVPVASPVVLEQRPQLPPDLRCAGHLVVLGGGNTAVDCARSALRAGAQRVTVAYRRSRAELPAIPEEVAQAEEEGVRFRFLAAPLGFTSTPANGAPARVSGVLLAEVDLGPPDESGRRAPVVSSRESELACDAVLLALGQSADLSLLPPGWTLAADAAGKPDGRVLIDGAPSAVFAAGDLATGDGTVTHAIGDGRRAMTRALRLFDATIPEFVRPDRARAVPASAIKRDFFARREPAHNRHLPPALRVRGFKEVDQGIGEPLEALRCFSCGQCTRCDRCLAYCPEGIVSRHGDGYAIDDTMCKGCGICVAECPRKAIEMRPV